MYLHEYQAKALLLEYGVPVPSFGVVSTVEEAANWIEDNQLQEAVVKVQVHAGGRGKAGGVKLARSPQKILEAVRELLGMRIVNEQTGGLGMVSNKVLISSPVEIEKEYYLGAVIDRASRRGMLLASPEGGVEIEETASKSPEKVLSIPIELNGEVRGYHLIRLAKFMGWNLGAKEKSSLLVRALARLFVEKDASLLEINPLVRSCQGELLALDAKLSIDDNALFRHQRLAGAYDSGQLPEKEARARQHDLAYVAMEGSVGCMVNGAGLAMATMDIIHHYGGSPANFLDVGGSADREKVAEGFKIILSDPKVEAILVNIFGGIMNCRTIAAGILAAAGEMEIKVPLIVRLEGTDVEEGRKMLARSDLNILVADSLEEAAQKSCQRR